MKPFDNFSKGSRLQFPSDIRIIRSYHPHGPVVVVILFISFPSFPRLLILLLEERSEVMSEMKNETTSRNNK